MRGRSLNFYPIVGMLKSIQNIDAVALCETHSLHEKCGKDPEVLYSITVYFL